MGSRVIKQWITEAEAAAVTKEVTQMAIRQLRMEETVATIVTTTTIVMERIIGTEAAGGSLSRRVRGLVTNVTKRQ
jgi:hypothetical protein